MAIIPRLLTIAEAAELSACHTKTLRRAIDQGELIASRLGAGPKSDRIHPDDLANWWRRCRVQAVNAPGPEIHSTLKAPPLDTAEERIAKLLASPNRRKRVR